MAKKKVKIILQVIMLVLVFVFLVAFMEIDGNIKYFETNYNEGDQTVAYVIETKEELELYVTDEEVLSNYEEEFFNDKHLVLVVVVLVGLVVYGVNKYTERKQAEELVNKVFDMQGQIINQGTATQQQQIMQDAQSMQQQMLQMMQ